MTPVGFTSYDDAMSAAQSLSAPVTTSPPGETDLPERERRILEFERQWWRYAGAKEQAIRDLFDLSSTRYYQALNQVIDDPRAMALDPLLVKRLRRLRSSRQQARSARRLGRQS